MQYFKVLQRPLRVLSDARGEKGRQEHEGARSRPSLRLKKKGRCTSAIGTRFPRRQIP